MGISLQALGCTVCRTIRTDLNDVCDKYHASLACILGNSFLYENEEEKKDVSETVSEILNLVMKGLLH